MSRVHTFFRLSVALAALAIGSGALQAAKLKVTPTSITVPCYTHINGQSSVNVTVTPASTLASGSTIAVTLPATFSGGLHVTAPSTTTLTSSNQSAGLVYAVSLTNGCSGVTNGASVSFSFLAGGSTDVSLSTTTNVISTPVLSLASATSTVNCSLQSGPATTNVVVTPTVTLTGTQTIPVTLPSSFSGGLTVTPPSVTTLSTTNQSAGLTYTLSTAAACAGVTNGGTSTFNFIANALTDASETVTTNLTSNTKLILSPATITPTCNTATGPSSTQVTVTPAVALSGSQTIAVGLPGSLSGGLVITPPSVTTLSTANQSTGLVYTVTQAAGCVGVTNGGTPSVTFTAASQADAVLNVTTTLANSTSGLQVTNASVTVNCVLDSGNYYPGAAQNIWLTSTATGGTPYTVSTSSLPAGVGVTPTAIGTAGSTAVKYSIQAASGCGGGAVNTSSSGKLIFSNSPGPDKVVTVVLQIVPLTTLQVSPVSPSLTYTKGTGTASSVTATITTKDSTVKFFTVDTTTMPTWLTVDTVSGSTPKALRFSTTSVCDTLAPGTYTGSVRLKETNYGDLSIPFTLLITNASPKLTVSPSQNQSLKWVVGQAITTGYITLFSSDSPISYSLTTGGQLSPSVSANLKSGLAYSFGTQIPVSFDSTVFAAAAPGQTLTGTVSITWGSPASITVVTFNIAVLPAQAALSGVTPGSIATATAGNTFQVTLTGTGFVTSSDVTQKTKVGIVSNGSLIQDTNIASNVTNSSNIILTITVPTVADSYLPFGSGGTVLLGVCNPQGSTCSVPTGTTVLTIGSGPAVQVVTSASSFQQVSGTPSVAPYDMVSVFGSNFCAGSTPACSSSLVMPGVMNATSMVYQTWLATDDAGATQRQLSVEFCPTGTTSGCTNAPLLFATNSQINLLVPGGLTSGSAYDILVNYGYGTGSTMLTSSPFTVNVVDSNPGIFAVGSDGQGDGAILQSSTYALINASNPAAMRQIATDSDYILIYMTGLGIPDSTDKGTGTQASPADCLTTAEYLSALNNQTSAGLSALDGAIVQSSLIPTGKKLPSCLMTEPTVTIGNVTAPAKYAGWVPDSVAGLYQVNVQLPSTAGSYTDVNGNALTKITAPVQLPITVTLGTVTSQKGVTIWVAPRLLVVAPTALTGTVGTAWATTGNAPTVSEGTPAYHYTIASGVLPTGLTMDATSGAISGTPAAGTSGTYTLTLAVSDSANTPVTGTATFTLTIAGGLIVTANPASYSHAVVTTSTTVAQAVASGGAYPYTYAFDNSFTPPAGMALSTTGALTITSATPGGTYNVKIAATDSQGWTGLVVVPVVLSLNVSANTPSTGLTGSGLNWAGTASAGPFTLNLAATGGSAYTFTAPSAPTGFSITGGNVLNISAAQNAAPYSVKIVATETTTGATGTITLAITMN